MPPSVDQFRFNGWMGGKYPQDLPEIEAIGLTRWPNDMAFEENRDDPSKKDQEEGYGYYNSQPGKLLPLHDTDGDGSEQEEVEQQGLRSTRRLSEMGSTSREVRVDGEGDPYGRSEQDEDPLEYMTFSKNVLEAMHAAPYGADGVDDEVDGEWGSDDDGYCHRVEFCELAL